MKQIIQRTWGPYWSKEQSGADGRDARVRASILSPDLDVSDVSCWRVHSADIPILWKISQKSCVYQLVKDLLATSSRNSGYMRVDLKVAPSGDCLLQRPSVRQHGVKGGFLFVFAKKHTHTHSTIWRTIWRQFIWWILMRCFAMLKIFNITWASYRLYEWSEKLLIWSGGPLCPPHRQPWNNEILLLRRIPTWPCALACLPNHSHSFRLHIIYMGFERVSAAQRRITTIQRKKNLALRKIRACAVFSAKNGCLQMKELSSTLFNIVQMDIMADIHWYPSLYPSLT